MELKKDKYNRPILLVMCGIPASGKSYLSSQLAQQGFIVHSSDKLREQYPNLVNGLFDKLHRNIIDDLRLGKNCIYDATNLSSNKRKYIVKLFNRCCGYNGVNIQLINFIPNIKVSLERNSMRNEKEKVPLDILMSMYNGYKNPRNEGFNFVYNIEVKE